MLEIKKGKLSIEDKKVVDFYTADVVKSGNSARINCQKKYMGKKVLVVVLDEEAEDE